MLNVVREWASGVSRFFRWRGRKTLQKTLSLACCVAVISWCAGCAAVESIRHLLPLGDLAVDTVAQSALRTAEKAARGVYAVTLPNAQNNFAGVYGSYTNVGGDAVDDTDLAAEEKAVEALSKQETSLHFVPWSSIGGALGGRASGTASGPEGDVAGQLAGQLEDVGGVTRVWVQMPYDMTAISHKVTIGSFNVVESSDSVQTSESSNEPLSARLVDEVESGTRIRAGDVIRMGVVSSSGSSFCVIIVANSSNGSVSGVGYQSVSQETTADGRGADCGAGAEGADRFKEMPGTIGTDPYLRKPVTFQPGEAYGGVLTDVSQLIGWQRGRE